MEPGRAIRATQLHKIINMNVKQLRDAINSLPDDAPVYFWLRCDGELECVQVKLHMVVPVESPAETSLHLVEA